MRVAILVILIVAVAVPLAGCRTYAEQGTAWGALAGGVIGYNAGYKDREQAALVGALIGGFVGHEIGEDMDRDEAYYRRNYDRRGYYEYDR
jgi:uncharacterized protein YcfJ